MFETKHISSFDLKSATAEGSFTGKLSVYNIVDDGGDSVQPGAYAKNIQQKGLSRPLLWSHDTRMPIGELTLDDRQDALWVKGQLLMSLPEAQKAYSLMKAGIMTG